MGRRTVHEGPKVMPLQDHLSTSLSECIDNNGVVVAVDADARGVSVQSHYTRGGGSQFASRQSPAVLNHWTPHGQIRITVEVL